MLKRAYVLIIIVFLAGAILVPCFAAFADHASPMPQENMSTTMLCCALTSNATSGFNANYFIAPKLLSTIASSFIFRYALAISFSLVLLLATFRNFILSRTISFKMLRYQKGMPTFIEALYNGIIHPRVYLALSLNLN